MGCRAEPEVGGTWDGKNEGILACDISFTTRVPVDVFSKKHF